MKIMINKCRISQSETIYGIIDKCKIALQAEGIFQWTDYYPTLKIIQDDIVQGNLYQIESDNTILGVINISNVQEEAYKTIQWTYPEETSLVIHRLAIDPIYQGQGLAQKLMIFAENYGVENGFHSIRLDAYSQNTRVLKFYEKRGYAKQGEVYFPQRDFPFYCYEKQLIRNEK